MGWPAVKRQKKQQKDTGEGGGGGGVQISFLFLLNSKILSPNQSFRVQLDCELRNLEPGLRPGFWTWTQNVGQSETSSDALLVLSFREKRLFYPHLQKCSYWPLFACFWSCILVFYFFSFISSQTGNVRPVKLIFSALNILHLEPN